MDVRRGDIMVSRQDTFTSKAMCFITGEKWSHASIYIGENTIISAVPFKGVSYGNLTLATERKYYRIKDASLEQANLIADFAISQLGKPYDFWQVIVLAYRIFFDKLLDKGDDDYPDKYVCSELVAEACATQGFLFGKYVDNVLPTVIADSPLVEEVKGP